MKLVSKLSITILSDINKNLHLHYFLTIMATTPPTTTAPIAKEDDNISRAMLFARVAEKHRDLAPQQIENVIRDIIDEMANNLIQGNEIAIRQLGFWKLKTRKAKNARNPKTGEALTVQGRETIHYRQSRYVFNLLNPHIKKTNRVKVTTPN